MPTLLTKRYYWTLGAATLWLLAIIAPSLTQLVGSPWGGLAYLFFHPVCHQLPERSFQLWNSQLAVCQRCSGIYFGFWLGILLLPHLTTISNGLLRRPWILGLFGLPMLINVFSPNFPLDRFLTGLLAGFPVSVFVVVAVEQFFFRPARRFQ